MNVICSYFCEIYEYLIVDTFPLHVSIKVPLVHYAVRTELAPPEGIVCSFITNIHL